MDSQETGWFKMKLFLKFTVFVLPTCFFIAFGQVNPSQFLNGNLNNAELKIVELNQTKAMPNRTSQSETIRKAGDDLRLGEEGSRVGAAKLLGKYPSSFSSKMLVGALNDKSNLVRRAAIVSLAEHASNGYYLQERVMVEEVFSKLADSDVEVRERGVFDDSSFGWRSYELFFPDGRD